MAGKGCIIPLDAVQLQAAFDEELCFTKEQGEALGMVRCQTAADC